MCRFVKRFVSSSYSYQEGRGSSLASINHYNMDDNCVASACISTSTIAIEHESIIIFKELAQFRALGQPPALLALRHYELAVSQASGRQGGDIDRAELWQIAAWDLTLRFDSGDPRLPRA